MTTIRVTDRDGQQHTLEASNGSILMETLRDEGMGVAAICGGQCACATCHCFIDPAWYDQLESAAAEEAELLEFLDFHEPGRSRLACQVIITDQLDGLLLTVSPEE
ncbi:MAG: 2Fe-2S iron-sulfur cluster binding domain-containing protein [Gammaproteobacteria bacterium]|jgi:ferredoxin, 2Fe-2S|nr:2Fe-2S iron-sulfur cluster binding domain-containing protein [Gammaproteobacteria bacterium]MBT6246307.1 2Fe-2S iron-sulfur cluster binding domain-containing protein [Gammaproteobacteria bacterium]